jgi:hypothetical protein
MGFDRQLHQSFPRTSTLLRPFLFRFTILGSFIVHQEVVL